MIEVHCMNVWMCHKETLYIAQFNIC
jgi:hypothetical protein